MPIPLHKQCSFSLRIPLVNMTKSTGNYGIWLRLLKKILNEKIHFLCSVNVHLGALNTATMMFKLLVTSGALEFWDEFGLS